MQFLVRAYLGALIVAAMLGCARGVDLATRRPREEIEGGSCTRALLFVYDTTTTAVGAVVIVALFPLSLGYWWYTRYQWYRRYHGPLAFPSPPTKRYPVQSCGEKEEQKVEWTDVDE